MNRSAKSNSICEPCRIRKYHKITRTLMSSNDQTMYLSSAELRRLKNDIGSLYSFCLLCSCGNLEAIRIFYNDFPLEISKKNYDMLHQGMILATYNGHIPVMEFIHSLGLTKLDRNNGEIMKAAEAAKAAESQKWLSERV